VAVEGAAEFFLEGGEVSLAGAVGGVIAFEAELAVGVDIPACFFAVGEGDFSANHGAGDGDLVDGEFDASGEVGGG